MNDTISSKENTGLTPARLRKHADAPDSIGWDGQARQLLRWAADLLEAAQAVVDERGATETTAVQERDASREAFLNACCREQALIAVIDQSLDELRRCTTLAWNIHHPTTMENAIEKACAGVGKVIQRLEQFIERREVEATPRPSDWRCEHCGRDNDPAETHCVQCEWSRKHTIAGVLHERWCGGSPCVCGAESK